MADDKRSKQDPQHEELEHDAQQKTAADGNPRKRQVRFETEENPLICRGTD
ncbi:MAG TPA: hypothetical protein VFQ53_31060 [Kofleriaceae bacterium]|nr:hypothetical protein [Kofleriaceae bacterium]